MASCTTTARTRPSTSLERQFTQAFGMNAEGEIVGTYFGASGELGFTAAPTPEPSSLISLAIGLVIIFRVTFLARGRRSGGRR